MKSLVIGMGIGRLYQAVLQDLGYQVITVDKDISKNATYTNVDIAIQQHKEFDTVHICTPNFTHVTLARKLAPVSKIVFIEKPGVATSDAWKQLVKDYPATRFMMVKNNQFRDEIKHYKDLADQSDIVRVTWNNRNRIPSPGSWFTDRNLSFGGVSRDLIPHMLSYYCRLTDYKTGTQDSAVAEQRWELDQIESTDYGFVNQNGVYNVDDYCKLEYTNGKTKWVLTANWRSLEDDNISIAFGMASSAVVHRLGLCPEAAYKTMIEQAVENIDDDEFWQKQYDQDVWIHEQIENL